MKKRSTHVPMRWLSVMAGAMTLASLLGLAACSDTHVQIDWVDVVQFHGIRYLASATTLGRAPADTDVGPVFATVRYKLADNVHDPNYRLKDGDAAFLDARTPVYSVKGYAPSFRLVARDAGRLTFYEADTNPHATTGADLLDIGGKVHSIGVNSEQDGRTEVGAVTDRTQVAALVAMVLAAPVNQRYQERDRSSYFIAFSLDDGTAVTRAYWLGSGELARGIMTPSAFGDAVKQAVAARSGG